MYDMASPRSSGVDESQQISLLPIQRQIGQSEEETDLHGDSSKKSLVGERNAQATPEQQHSDIEPPEPFQITPIDSETGLARSAAISGTTSRTEIPQPWWHQLFFYSKGHGKKGYSGLNKLGQNTKEQEEKWITAVLLRAKGATAILIINLILMMVAGIQAAKGNGSFISGVYSDALSPAFYQGDCSTSSHLSTALHLLISILSTGLLMCSNFTMQCLNAPSRADTDAAHLKGKWLEVGTSSGLRNFLVMDWRRKILWLLLLVTSLPIHLIYNSAVFTSIATQDYGVVVVPNNYSENDSLVDNALAEDAFRDFVGYNASDIHNAMFNGSLQTLTAKQCLERYAVDYNTVGGTVVAYMDADHNNILQASARSLRALSSGHGRDFRWICSSGFCGLQAEPSNLNFFVRPAFWVYPNRTFTLPNYEGQYQTFDSSTLDDYSFGLGIFEVGADFLGSPNDWVYDMLTFFKYIVQHNPSDQELRSYMEDNSTSIWKNLTWRGDVSFNTVGPTDNGTLISMMAAAAEEFYDWQEADTMSSRRYEVSPAVLWNVSVSHCQSQPATPRCQARFSIGICLIVLICNGTKVACIFLAARRKRQDIFLTTGDALSSFLHRPDMATKDKCLMYSPTESRQSWPHTLSGVKNWIRSVSRRKNLESSNEAAIPLTSTADATLRRVPLFPHAKKMPRKRRWFQAGTWSLWTIVLIYLASCLALGPMFAAFASVSGGGGLAGGGFGTMNTNSMSVTYDENFYSLVLISNSPQIVLTILYFFVNALFTSMLAAAEYNDYAIERKPLRVSWPKDQQRSTYRLSLPYRYSVALMIISTLLHWLLTESFFLVLINDFDIHGQLNLENSKMTVSFSVIPMIVVCVVLGASLVGILLISLRRFKSSMPLLTTKFSYGLSAACHPPVDDTDAAFQAVQWGEIPGSEYTDQDDISERGADMFTRNAHCSFSSREVNVPSRTVIYV